MFSRDGSIRIRIAEVRGDDGGCGSRVGPYEIVASIGAGGMGEVFRARDTKLRRDAAIKVLPATFAQDPERLARSSEQKCAALSAQPPLGGRRLVGGGRAPPARHRHHCPGA